MSNRLEGADTINNRSKSVNLYTAEGEFVANAPMLPFVSPPVVLFWGLRTFVFTLLADNIKTPFNGQYREVFAYAIPIYETVEEQKGKPVTNRSIAGKTPQERVNNGITYVNERVGEICPVCGQFNGLHSFTCPNLQKELTEVSKIPDAPGVCASCGLTGNNGNFCPRCGAKRVTNA